VDFAAVRSIVGVDMDAMASLAFVCSVCSSTFQQSWTGLSAKATTNL